MSKTSTFVINMANLAAQVFFNVYNNGKVKVVWRWKDASISTTSFQYKAKWMTKTEARKVYANYKPQAV